MTKEVDALSFADAIEKQEKSNAAMSELDPGGRYEPAPIWCHHKDGKIVKPFTWWKPGAALWSEWSARVHENQAKDAAEFNAHREEKIRREKLQARRNEVETDFGADVKNPATNESRSNRQSVELIVG